MKKLIAFVLALIFTLGLVGCNSNSSPEEEILSIALEHCKTNYDYTDITYIDDREVWEVGFWENNAKIASQTITIDKDGNVVNVWWAE